MDRDMSQSAAQQNPNLVRSSSPMLLVYHLTMQTEKRPFDDVRVRQAISEALQREAFGELGTQSGAVGTGTYPLGPWGMPKEMRHQLIGYGPDMAKRIAHAKELLASYEKEKGKIGAFQNRAKVVNSLPSATLGIAGCRHNPALRAKRSMRLNFSPYGTIRPLQSPVVGGCALKRLEALRALGLESSSADASPPRC
jgi:hypothetical protein